MCDRLWFWISLQAAGGPGPVRVAVHRGTEALLSTRPVRTWLQRWAADGSSLWPNWVRAAAGWRRVGTYLEQVLPCHGGQMKCDPVAAVHVPHPFVHVARYESRKLTVWKVLRSIYTEINTEFTAANYQLYTQRDEKCRCWAQFFFSFYCCAPCHASFLVSAI